MTPPKRIGIGLMAMMTMIGSGPSAAEAVVLDPRKLGPSTCNGPPVPRRERAGRDPEAVNAQRRQRMARKKRRGWA